MVKMPKDPRDIFQEITEDYQKAFGNSLVSIILYGSGAGGEYVPERSDLNFLVVLSEEGMETLERSFKVVSKWRKRNVPLPLLLSRHYIASSLDAFPVEFLNMKMSYALVFGEDVLADLSFEKEHLRIQCERELKAKLLQLRQGYLDASQRKGNMEALIVRSVPAFIAIFRALLYLKDIKAPTSRTQIISRICEEFDLDGGTFSTLVNVKDRGIKVSKVEMDGLIHRYIKEIERLSSIVDNMEI